MEKKNIIFHKTTFSKLLLYSFPDGLKPKNLLVILTPFKIFVTNQINKKKKLEKRKKKGKKIGKKKKKQNLEKNWL